MHIKLTTMGGAEILVRVADIAMVVRHQGRTDLTPLPGLADPMDETLFVRQSDAYFRELPGMLPTRIVEPHGEPREAVVNVGAASVLEGCDEGVLVQFAGGSGRKVLVESSLDVVIAALEHVFNAD